MGRTSWVGMAFVLTAALGLSAGAAPPGTTASGERSVTAMMVSLDRNHPSVVMWGLLNETSDGPVFRHAVAMLPTVRALDETRLVVLNSGRFDSPVGGGSLAGLSFWRTPETQDPNVTYNGTERPITALGITWVPGRLALHPGAKGEYCALRWTAPADGEFSLAAEFASIAERATTDVHVIHARSALFDSFTNLQGNGPVAAYSGKVQAKAGDTIDFVVGQGNGQCGGDCTGVEVSITSRAGTPYAASTDFTGTANPSGAWSYGQLSPTDKPDTSTFAPYARGETIAAATGIGSISNPGSREWENVLSDQHRHRLLGGALPNRPRLWRGAVHPELAPHSREPGDEPGRGAAAVQPAPLCWARGAEAAGGVARRLRGQAAGDRVLVWCSANPLSRQGSRGHTPLRTLALHRPGVQPTSGTPH